MVALMVGLSNLTNMSGIYDMAQFANDATANMFWMIIIISIYIIIIVKLHQHGIERALAVASFAGLMLSLPLLFLGFLNIAIPIIFAVMIAASLAYIRMSESP